jgi:hypothetical protein
MNEIPAYIGCRVRITEDRYDDEDVWVALVATTGSLGTVISYEAYADQVRRDHASDPAVVYAGHLAFAQCAIGSNEKFAVRFDHVEPPAESVCQEWEEKGWSLFVLCKVGEAQLLSPNCLAIL